MKATSFALMLFLALPLPVQAAGVSGAGMSLAWGLPFAGLLLSIALMPLLAGHVWHHH
ncbi:MAG: sodium:proton antiporter, partial [Alphaproteobacteria bacterium]